MDQGCKNKPSTEHAKLEKFSKNLNDEICGLT